MPHEPTLQALWPLWPKLLSYLMSFVFIGIYWNNHHHLWQVVEHVNGAVLWANLHLLFWLSLVPFVTAWMGENHFASAPVALYGVVLLGVGLRLLHHGARCCWATTRTTRCWRARWGATSRAACRSGSTRGDRRGLRAGRGWRACATARSSVIWLVPDRRIEKVLAR